MEPMTAKEWDTLNDLLIKAADQPLPTWAEKRKQLELNLTKSGLCALKEIVSWGWEE